MVKIFICYSFDTQILPEFQAKPNIYIPIKCGDYENPNIQFSDKIGDSISKYNRYVNEMSMIWTLGKNLDMFGDFEYIGTAHYRRYLAFMFSQLQKNNILAYKEVVGPSILWLYDHYHKISDLKLFLEFFNKEFPDLQHAMTEYMNQNVFYKCNMFIMHRDMFKQYFKFIERCTSILIYKVLPLVVEDLKTRDKYQIRIGAFILERMTSFWIWLQQKNNCNIINTFMLEENIKSIYARP